MDQVLVNEDHDAIKTKSMFTYFPMVAGNKQYSLICTLSKNRHSERLWNRIISKN